MWDSIQVQAHEYIIPEKQSLSSTDSAEKHYLTRKRSHSIPSFLTDIQEKDCFSIENDIIFLCTQPPSLDSGLRSSAPLSGIFPGKLS